MEGHKLLEVCQKGVNCKMQKWECIIIFRESQLRWAGMKHFIKGHERKLKRTLDFFGCNVSGNYWPLCSPDMPFISRRPISVLKEQPAIIKVEITLAVHSEQVPNIIEQRRLQYSQGRRAMKTPHPKNAINTSRGHFQWGYAENCITKEVLKLPFH